jgi:hypothetical protein
VTLARPGRLRLAELTSGVGAVVLGIGLGALMANRLAGFGPVILALGITLHAWGMYDKHCQESRRGIIDPWWATTLYWTCWIGLAGMLAWIVTRA